MTTQAACRVDEIADIPFLGEQREEKMDAYVPRARRGDPLAAVVLLHGGGWGVGSRKRRREVDFARRLAASGFAVFCADYTLSRWSGKPFASDLLSAAWPQCLFDCKAAVRYVRKHAGEYGVDPRRIGVAGGCAGGHLALLTAFTGEDVRWNCVGPNTEASGAVACVIAAREFSDVRNAFSRWLLPPKDAGNGAVQALASPVEHVTAKAPPVLILHGDADRVVDIEQSRRLDFRLAECGVEHRLIPVAGGRHSMRLYGPDRDLMPVVETFLRWHLLF